MSLLFKVIIFMPFTYNTVMSEVDISKAKVKTYENIKENDHNGRQLKKWTVSNISVASWSNHY